MKISLRPETEQRISEKVRRGEFASADAMVEQAVTFFLDYEEEEMDEAEFQDVRAAVAEGVGQAERGEGVSLGEFDQMMRAKYGIRR